MNRVKKKSKINKPLTRVVCLTMACMMMSEPLITFATSVTKDGFQPLSDIDYTSEYSEDYGEDGGGQPLPPWEISPGGGNGAESDTGSDSDIESGGILGDDEDPNTDDDEDPNHPDTDDDGYPDYPDTDGDGYPDYPDTNGDGEPDYPDIDGDGEPDPPLSEKSDDFTDKEKGFLEKIKDGLLNFLYAFRGETQGNFDTASAKRRKNAITNTKNEHIALTSMKDLSTYSTVKVGQGVINIDEIRNLIEEYMDIKYMTTQDIKMIEATMYLSQFCELLHGNLENVVKEIRSALQNDATNELKSLEANLPFSLEEWCKFIEQNYYITYLYKSKNGKDFEIATVKDLFFEKAYNFYIKDTIYIPSSSEYVSDRDFTDAEVEAAGNDVAKLKAEALINDTDEEKWLPFVDYKMRTTKGGLKLTKMGLTPIDTYTCVLAKSLATEASLGIMLEEYIKANPKFKLSNLKDALGGEELGIDSFGNILGFKNKVMMVPAIMNPTLVAEDGYEKLNLASYNIRSAYAQEFNRLSAYDIPLKNTDPDKEKWTSRFLNRDDYQDYFVYRYTSSYNGWYKSKGRSGDYFPGYHLSKSGYSLVEAESYAMLYSTGPSLRKLRGDFFYRNEYDGYSVYPIYTKSLGGLQGSTAITQFGTLPVSMGNGTKTTTGEIITAQNKVNGKSVYAPVSKLSLKRKLETCLLYLDSGILSSTYLFNKEAWDKMSEITKIYLNNAPAYLQKLYEDANDKNCPVTEDYVALPNSHMTAGKDMAGQSEAQTEGTDDKNPDTLTNDEKEGSPEDDEEIEQKPGTVNTADVCMLGILVYNAEEVVKQTEHKLVIVDTLGVMKEVTVNYQQLLFNIFKNTNQSRKRLDRLGELSKETQEEMSKAKGMEIINMVFTQMTNPIMTALKYVAGVLQAAHMALTSGNLNSLFYMSTQEVLDRLNNIPAIFMAIGILLLLTKVLVLSFKFLFNESSDLKKSIGAIIIAAALLLLPTLVLNFCVDAVEYISNHCMNGSMIKYSVTQIEGSLKEKLKSNEAEAEYDKVSQYFIESFKADKSSRTALNELDLSKVNVTGEYNYKKFDVEEIGNLLRSADVSYADAKQHFVAVLGEYYNRSIFYYFIDYYLNQYVKDTELDLSGEDWVKTLEDSLQGDLGYLESKYLNRQFVYGATAKMLKNNVVADIFGLGTLLHHDGSTSETRGYPLPIEIMDTEYTNYNDLSITSNSYWRSILGCGGFNINSAMETRAYKKADRYGKPTLLPEEEMVLRSKPAYNTRKLTYIRPVIAVKSDKKIYLNANPVLMTGQDQFVGNAIAGGELIAETKLWSVNKNIYKRISSYMLIGMKNVHTYTDIIQLAAVSTFEFNKEFGRSGTIFSPIQMNPVSYAKEELNFDVIMKTMFNKDNKLLESYDLMYELVLHNWGLLAAIFLVASELAILVYLALRMLHLVQIYIIASITSSIVYGWKLKLQNKIWLGLLAQVAYFIGCHFLLIMMLNLFTMQPFPANGFISTVLSILLFIVSIVAVVAEFSMIVFVFNHAKDLGGELIADKLTATVSKLNGKFKGAMNAESKTGEVSVEAQEAQNKYNTVNNDEDLVDSENTKLDKELQHATEQIERNSVDVLSESAPESIFDSTPGNDEGIGSVKRNGNLGVMAGAAVGAAAANQYDQSNNLENDNIVQEGTSKDTTLGFNYDKQLSAADKQIADELSQKRKGGSQ